MCMHACCHSVMSNFLWLHGLQPARLLCPWASPGKNTGVGCHARLQGIFPTQGLNLHLLHCRWILYPLNHLGSPQQRIILPKCHYRHGWEIVLWPVINSIDSPQHCNHNLITTEQTPTGSAADLIPKGSGHLQLPGSWWTGPAWDTSSSLSHNETAGNSVIVEGKNSVSITTQRLPFMMFATSIIH